EAVRGYASSVKDTLRNAFLIGTAAATMFFYKLQPVVEQVMEFEKELMNAQSIFQVHRSELHELSDVVTEFGLQYGIAYDTAVKGLYQYASAGVEASEANEMLAHTLKLSMAVQGDHEALAKLTTQTIMGFGMEFSDAAEVTDKFAHSINKSLIEWDDLASSVKFALPFFISTGQSIDQLLGSLEILTNRALEAGIAGRGLRQALAEFTQHAEDNTAAFHKMGVNILDMQGNMKPLTDIAQQFKDLMGPAVNDMDIMMALMEDLNIRGATAFVHLVQNAEEFQAAVDNLSNSAGSATEMAEIQQQSLAMQIQRVKNALLAPFLFSDKIGEANDTLNEFTFEIKKFVDELVGFFIIEDEMGNRLTQHGEEIRTFVVDALKVAVEVVRELKEVFLENGDGLKVFTNLLHLSTKPLMLMLKVLGKLGPRTLQLLV
ncbi:MAG: phage tail tape measure protein, partial [Anaerolineales bacterium]|nr:phage tail tape measure protein [Anaerolineales bacterium]